VLTRYVYVYRSLTVFVVVLDKRNWIKDFIRSTVNIILYYKATGHNSQILTYENLSGFAILRDLTQKHNFIKNNNY